MDRSTQGYNLGSKARDFKPPHGPSPIPDILEPSVPSLKPTVGTMATLHPPELGRGTPRSYKLYVPPPHRLSPHRPPET